MQLVVEGFNGAVTTIGDDTQLERAYELALLGPRRKEQPPGDPAKFGDDPPF